MSISEAAEFRFTSRFPIDAILVDSGLRDYEINLDRRFSAEIRGVSLGFMRTYKTYLSAKQEQDGHLFLPYDSGICGC